MTLDAIQMRRLKTVQNRQQGRTQKYNFDTRDVHSISVGKEGRLAVLAQCSITTASSTDFFVCPPRCRYIMVISGINFTFICSTHCRAAF